MMKRIFLIDIFSYKALIFSVLTALRRFYKLSNYNLDIFDTPGSTLLFRLLEHCKHVVSTSVLTANVTVTMMFLFTVYMSHIDTTLGIL